MIRHRRCWRWVSSVVTAVSMISLSWASGPIVQKTFESPQGAVQAVLQACEHNDVRRLLEYFGQDGKDIIESGDRKEDRLGRRRFVALAKEKTNLSPDPADPNKMVLSIGDQDWPFPVPLIKKDGQWIFDSSQGREEIVARRVGANELTAVEVCRGYVEAQMEYAQNHKWNGIPEYAQKIVSTPGQEDGLYWKPGKGEAVPDISEGFSKAAAGMTESKRVPYHGYLFAVLKAQGKDAQGGAMNYLVKDHMIGGFALVAWPAEYGVSGVQTFIVSNYGTVYEKNLDEDTAQTAKAMTDFNPDASWTVVPETTDSDVPNAPH